VSSDFIHPNTVKEVAMSADPEHSESPGVSISKAVIREDILQSFPGLFGTKTINDRRVNVEEEIAALARELHPEIAAVLTARQRLLRSQPPVREKYAWPKWDDTFEDPSTGQFWTYRQIVQGLIDNFLDRDSEYR
jgi:malate synthase